MSLPLDEVVKVSINVGPVSKVRSKFDLGLILGKSNVINTTQRVKVYSGTEMMLADGFTKDSPEYKAANLYFAQEDSPNRVAIGRIGKKNSSGEVAESSLYATDDQVVAAFNETFEEGDPGSETLEDETVLEALTACRIKNEEWYSAFICDATDSDLLLAAQYIEGSTIESTLFYSTNSEDNLEGTESCIAAQIKSSGFKRTIGMYSSTPYAGAAPMAYALGHSDIAFDLNNKSLKGVAVENLNQTQVLKLRELNMNYYINRGGQYDLFEKGKTSDGTFFDELFNLDMLKNELQSAAINVYVSNPKIPQTDSGIETTNAALIPVLEKFVKKGFIAPGVWNSANILTVKTGDVLPLGYLIISDSINAQSQADREERKAPDTYILVKLAGSIQSANIGIYVNR